MQSRGCLSLFWKIYAGKLGRKQLSGFLVVGFCCLFFFGKRTQILVFPVASD